MSFAIAILVVSVVGYAVASTVRIRDARRENVLLVQLGLVPGIGFGLLSIWYMVSVAAALPGWIEIGVELLAAIGAGAWLYFNHQPFSGAPQPRPRLGFLLAAIISVAGLIASYWIRYTRQPLGEWDAWAIWNYYARLLDRAGHDWVAALRGSTQADYPLLLPLTVARLWHSVRAEPTWVPALVGFVFLLATIAILYGALGIVARPDAACIGVVVLSMNSGAADWASSQYADWPLAYFFTACLVLILLGRRTIVLAGLMAGLAAWTKNEGLLFALVLSLTLSILDRPMLRAFLPSLALGLAVVFWYKWTIHMPNYIFQASKPDSVTGLMDVRPLLVRVTDLHRLRLIILSFGHQLVGLGMLLSPAVILALQPSRTEEWLSLRLQVRTSRALLACVATLLLMIAGYGGIYVITPWNVQIHLMSSVDRLFVQLFPGIVLCVLSAIMASTSTCPATAVLEQQLPVHSSTS